MKKLTVSIVIILSVILIVFWGLNMYVEKNYPAIITDDYQSISYNGKEYMRAQISDVPLDASKISEFKAKSNNESPFITLFVTDICTLYSNNSGTIEYIVLITDYDIGDGSLVFVCYD